MNTMIQLKLKLQHSKNIYLKLEKPGTASNSASGSNSGSAPTVTQNFTKIKGKLIYEGGENEKDCYMVILQNWTPCTLACGGGKSYLQLMKVEAREGGKDCKTKDTILTRDCNVQSCPQVNQVSNVLEKNRLMENSNFVGNADVKMMTISKRPQRYDKCHLKETDALMEKKDESTKDFQNFPKIPVRLLMNERTVTAYMDDTLTNKVQTYLLDQSKIYRIKDDENCFGIENNIRNDKFCMLDSAKGNFVEEWLYDFNLFKNQCKTERAKSTVVLTEQKKLESEFQNRIQNIKMELVQDKANLIKKSLAQKEKREKVSKVDEIRQISLKAIDKEMRLEDLIEKEEESKEEDESISLEKKIEEEEKKEECLMKSIKEKQIEIQYNMAKTQAEHAIRDIALRTKDQIRSQRQSIAKKIMEMRQKQKLKKSALKSQILAIRTKIAQKMKEINHEGKSRNCTQSNTPDLQLQYCNKHFSDNYLKHIECQSKESFCYMCCENEFGDLHMVKREQCYGECDQVSSNAQTDKLNDSASQSNANAENLKLN